MTSRNQCVVTKKMFCQMNLCFLLDGHMDIRKTPQLHHTRMSVTRMNFGKVLFFFFATYVACGNLVPQPGIKPMPPAVGAQSLNHWTFREVLVRSFFLCLLITWT